MKRPEIIRMTAVSVVVMLAAVCAGFSSHGNASADQAVQEWKIHDPDRPQPPVVTPAPVKTTEPYPLPPSDAVILFDGTDLSMWRSRDGGPAGWKFENGYMEIIRGTGLIRTVEGFGSCQLHLEYASPSPPSGRGQSRGNSGVFLMERYEVQILDSFENETYADGMAAAIYGQYPPLYNACRPPGQWQSFDIIFHRPRFNSEGGLISPARMTVFHNGVLVHENAELTGPTVYRQRPPYEAHPDRVPISLQDHGQPVRFRNIWVRELP